VDREVEVGLAPCQSLRERERVAGLDEHVKPPALDLLPVTGGSRGELEQLKRRLRQQGVTFVLACANPACHVRGATRRAPARAQVSSRGDAGARRAWPR